MRTVLAFVGILVVACVLAVFASHIHPGGSLPPAEQEETQPPPSNPTPGGPNDPRVAVFEKVKKGAVRATLEIADRGTVTLELYPEAAPKTVAHFVDLCKHHFYEGIKVHRLEPPGQGSAGVVQMGDPVSKDTSPDQFEAKGVGSHGSGKTVPLEATLLNVKNSVGLARSEDQNSGDSQFYINLQDNAGFDGSYCVFGRVVGGADVVPKIQKGDVIKRLSVP